MADITSDMIKELREKTLAGMLDCKKALTECGGDMEKAVEYLRKKGLSSAAKKAERTAKEGYITSYIHTNNKVGVLLQLNCETDFVARNEEFRNLAKEIAMQIAAISPQYVSSTDVPAEVVEKEKEIYREQMKDSGKPANVIEKILEGKVKKFYSEVCLLDQEYIKDGKLTINDLLKNMVATLGENISVGRFERFQIGK
ncbi:MAG: translation elongation factor Ts [Spirochaetes bacterium]|nr:translation elongation factor Ts [Spirochaetota bacterium]HPA72016.1 translation elongation factor Ts [Spirochaetota bacterium]